MKIAYIDAQNIHKGIQGMGWTIDWAKLKAYLEEKYQINELQIFFGYLPKYQKLYDFLITTGYKVIFKEVSTNEQGEIKGNVDIDIAIKSMNDIIDNTLTEAYLLTSDVDYNSLIYEFRRRALWGRLLVTNLTYTSKYLRKASGSAIQSLSDIKHVIAFEEKQKETSLR